MKKHVYGLLVAAVLAVVATAAFALDAQKKAGPVVGPSMSCGEGCNSCSDCLK